MRSFFVSLAAVYLAVGAATAQPVPTSHPLSLDQQNKISEIVTDRILHCNVTR
jgi:hypothetical protein